MNLPVESAAFWLGRIEMAADRKHEHYSVYLVPDPVWEDIGRVHEGIIREKCAGMKTLDAGCGYGRASQWVENYMGVDISPDLLRIARAKYPGKCFLEADLGKLPFEDLEFDIAFCISIKQMIVSNVGDRRWLQIQRELKRVARQLLIFEYIDPGKYETV